MPQHRGKPAGEFCEIGQIKLRRALADKDAVEGEISDQRGDRPFEHIQKERQKADFQPEVAAHVERTGIAAAEFSDVRLFQL